MADKDDKDPRNTTGDDRPADDRTQVMPSGGMQSSDDMTRIQPLDDATRMMPVDDEGDATRPQPPVDDATVVIPAAEDATVVMGADSPLDATVVLPESGDLADSQANVTPSMFSDVTTRQVTQRELVDVESIRRQGKTVIRDRFVLDQLLGAGGMGSVYRAKDLRKVEARDRNPWLAIKLLNDDFREHPSAFVSLQREARKSQTLAHPNIVQVFDFDREDDTVYMTMELLQGNDLTRLIRSNPEGVDLDRALLLAQKMGAALGHAHQHKITHADFKPGNVFLTKDDRVKVLDFGIAQAVYHAETDADLGAGSPDDEDNTIFDPSSLGAMTPAYASLEMLAGMDPLPSDDIYALGCVVYQLLTGAHPYDKLPATEALTQKLTPVRPSKLSRRKWRALQKAIALRRANRYERVEDFLNEFAPVAQRWRKRLAVAVIGALLVGGLGAYQGLTSRWADSERNREISARQADLAEQAQQLDLAKGVQTQLDADFGQRQGTVELNKSALDQALFAFDGSRQWRADIERQLEQLDGAFSAGAWVAKLESSAISDNAVLEQLRTSEEARRASAQRNLDEWLVGYRQKMAGNYLELARSHYGEIRFVDAQMAIEAAVDLDPQVPRLLEVRRGLERAVAANRAENAALAREAAEAERLRRQLVLEEEFAALDQLLRSDLENCTATLDSTGRGGSFTFDIAALAQRMHTQAERFASLPDKLASARSDYIKRLGECIRIYGYSDPAAAREKLVQAQEAFPGYAQSLAELPITPWNTCKPSFAGRGQRYDCRDRFLSAPGKGPTLVVVPAGNGLQAFAIGKYEVTVEEFNTYCSSTGECALSDEAPELPATRRSATEVKGYLAWLSATTGFSYHLPSIEQWRYAAAALDSQPDSGRNCALSARGIVKGEVLLPAEIGGSNAWGLVHYVGNVRELVVAKQGLRGAGGSRTDPMDSCNLSTISAVDSAGDEVTGIRVLRATKPANSIVGMNTQDGALQWP